MMNLRIQNVYFPHEKPIMYSVQENTSILSVKNLLSKEYHTFPKVESIKLVCAGKVLKDEELVNQLSSLDNIVTLHLVIKDQLNQEMTPKDTGSTFPTANRSQQLVLIAGIPYYADLPVIPQTPLTDPIHRPIQPQQQPQAPPQELVGEAAPQNPFFVISRLAIIVMLLSQHGSYSRMITLLCMAIVIALAELGYLNFLRRQLFAQRQVVTPTAPQPPIQDQQDQGFLSFFLSTAYSFISSLIPT